MIFEALMVALLAWQIWMPATNNGMWMFQVDRDGTVIRMNTQTGAMERCTSDLVCGPVENQPIQRDYKY